VTGSPLFGNRLYYSLIGRLPVPCRDMIEWARWMEKGERVVAQTQVGPLWISTVFLGLDHNHSGRGDPLLFETMIFGDAEERGEGDRYTTWDEAERGHARFVEECRRRLADTANTLKSREDQDNGR
jgi:hypothetical protein